MATLTAMTWTMSNENDLKRKWPVVTTSNSQHSSTYFIVVTCGEAYGEGMCNVSIV